MPALAFGGADVTLILGTTNSSIPPTDMMSAPSKTVIQTIRIVQDHDRGPGSDCGLMAATSGMYSQLTQSLQKSFFDASNTSDQLFPAALNTALSAGQSLGGYYPMDDGVESPTDTQTVNVKADADPAPDTSSRSLLGILGFSRSDILDRNHEGAAIGYASLLSLCSLESAGMLLLAGTMPFICRRRWVSK